MHLCAAAGMFLGLSVVISGGGNCHREFMESKVEKGVEFIVPAGTESPVGEISGP